MYCVEMMFVASVVCQLSVVSCQSERYITHTLGEEDSEKEQGEDGSHTPK